MAAKTSLSRTVRRVLLAGLVLGWSATVVSITVAALPYNPLTMPFGQERGIKMFVPEGWGFFTRDPREPDLIVLTKSTGSWRILRNMPIASAANAFGIDRYPRAQSVELAMILHGVSDADWKGCSVAVETCLDRTAAIPVTDRSPYPTLRGTLGLVKQEPIPWAWSANSDMVVMPSAVVVVNVDNRVAEKR